MSKKHTLVKLSAFTAILGGIYAFSNYIYKFSSVPRQHTDDDADFDPAITEGRKFIRNHPDRQDIYVKAVDDIQLHACYIKAGGDSHKYVILLHGIWDNHEGNGVYAKHYLEKGFNCLLPDLRGFGKSEGSYIGYGFDDRMDTKKWIYWIREKDPNASIVIHGMSMGAATTLMTTGEYLPGNVKAAISDSSFSTLREQFANSASQVIVNVLPVPVSLFLARIMIRLRSGFDINDVDCLAAVTRSRIPTLFIHGDDDTFVDPHMCSRLYEAAKCPKQYCMILGAKHIEGVVRDPVNYWNKVDAFLEKQGF